MAAAANAASLVRSRLHRCLRSGRAAGRSAMAECLHSALKSIAMWMLNVLVPRPATMEKQKRCANTAAWWVFVTQVGLGEGRPG